MMSRVDARPPVYRKPIEVVRISRGGGLGSRDQGGRGVPSMAWCLASSCASSTNVAVAQAMPLSQRSTVRVFTTFTTNVLNYKCNILLLQQQQSFLPSCLSSFHSVTAQPTTHYRAKRCFKSYTLCPGNWRMLAS